MALVHFALLEGHLHLRGQFEQSQVVGNGRPLLAHLLRERVLRQVVLLDQVLVGQCYLDGIEVFALNVLHQRHLHHVLVVSRAHISRNRKQARHLRGAPTSFTGDDLIGAIVHFAERDGLDHPDLSDALGQFFERLRVKLSAGLIGIGHNRANVDLADARRAVGMHLTGRDERIESASECRIFLLYGHVVNLVVEKCGEPAWRDQAGVFFWMISRASDRWLTAPIDSAS